MILSIPAERQKKEVTVVCTDTRVEIPAIAEIIEGTLDRMRKCSQQNGLNISAYLLKPIYEESFWVNIIGQGYPPPNRTFRWCTPRMKIDPVNEFSESHRATGLPDDLLNILKDDLESRPRLT